MARDTSSERMSDIERTAFTINSDTKAQSECLSSDDVSSDIKKRDHSNRVAFVGGGTLEAYEPIPEYEGRHRYDPKAQWTVEEEKRLVRKLDYRICSWVCLMFFGK